MRGSLRPSAIRVERTSRSASFTRRMRSPGTLLPQNLARRNHPALEADPVGELGLDVALHVIRRSIERAGVAADEARGQRRALPQVVMIGFRHRGAEALLELGLQRQQFLPLPLQRAVLGEVQVDLDDYEVAQLSSWRSTWLFSYTSITSPSFT